MLRRANDIKGFTLGAIDGEIGRAKDFYFDDESWTVRYLVADTGKWLALRQVLISPFAVRGFRDHDNTIDVNLTKEQIERSPSIDQNLPVSRQFEVEYYRYYNWPFYWQGPALWGPPAEPADPGRAVLAPGQPGPELERPAQPEFAGDPHLRSTGEVTGYYIQARDGDIGHVEDFLIDDEGWSIEYLMVSTSNWWPGRKVLIPPAWATSLDWDRSKVHMLLDRQTIKSAPEFDPSQPITREYETQLFAHYDQRPYWAHREAA